MVLEEPLAPLEPLVLVPVDDEVPGAPVLRVPAVLPVWELDSVPANPVELVEPPAELVEPVESAPWLLPPVECGGVPLWEVSAWASPDPLASAAPTPRVSAPAPSQLDTGL